MPPREFRPPEEKTSPVLFFVVGVLMVAVTFWTVWDEIYTRRPWKDYQAQFNSYESGLIRNKLADSRKKVGTGIARLDTQIAKLKAETASDAELAALRVELADRELEAFEKVQEYGFAKAKYDEAYFELNENIRKGHDIAEIGAHVDELRQEVARTKNPAGKAEAARDAVEAKIEAKKKPLRDLQKRRQEVAKDVLDLERRLDSIGRRTQEIKQIVLKAYERNNFNEPVLRADRCQSCHLGTNLAGFEMAPRPLATHPNREFFLGKHDIDKIGCQSCHGGQGSALKTVALAHGEDHFWEDKLLPKNELGSKCYACHGNVINLEKAPILARGVSLVRELGCSGCHKIPGTDDLRKRGPDLSRIREKVKPGWLVSWIKRPKDYNPRTKMPFFSLSDKESVDIASYLWGASTRKAASEKIDGLSGAAAIAEGKKLFEAVGCLGCHVRDDGDDNPGPALKGVGGRPIVIRNRDFAPAVGNIGSKVQPDWLVRWLKKPKSYWHGTTMPNLRLSGDEAKSIAAYLLSLSPAKKTAEVRLDDRDAFKRGETLVRRRGCHGCHVIPGMETASKIGPDLTRFAAKKEFELSFGNVVNIEHNWDTWTFGKLKNPKIFQTERTSLRMPNFDLSDGEARALRTFLRAMVPHGPPHSVHQELDERAEKIELGRRMIEKYNCTGCHIVENWGGDLLRRYKDKNNGPPDLSGEGKKVQPDWFFGFLNNVVILRPWLKVRMPSFEMPEKDMTALVNYFAALDGELQPYFHFDKTKVKPETLKVARDLFSKAECFSCHGDWPPPPGKEPPSAPSLSFAKHRLRPDWIFRWITNPQKIRPGSKMPVFFEGAGITAEILSGKRTGSEDGRWQYELTQKGEAELAEDKPATLRIGGKTLLVIAGEADEKKIKISSPENLGAQFGRASIESHGEPIDEEVLGGDGYRQIDALKKFLMTEENFKPAATPQAAAPSAPGRS